MKARRRDPQEPTVASDGDRAERDFDIAKPCWGAVTTLAVDRAAASVRLQTCFCAGKPPEALDERMSGHFLTTTFGAGVDQLFAPLARVWMPWQGKIFHASSASGWNWFADSARSLTRLVFPTYEGVTDDRPGTFKAFRFRTTRRRSELLPDVGVLRIDYDLPENPRWPIRRIVDELVQIGDDVYLGQALLSRGKSWLRAAWFALEAAESTR